MAERMAERPPIKRPPIIGEAREGRYGKESPDLAFCRSRLSESNRRPSHYESVCRRFATEPVAARATA